MVWCLSKEEVYRSAVRIDDDLEQQIQDTLAIVYRDFLRKRVESLPCCRSVTDAGGPVFKPERKWQSVAVRWCQECSSTIFPLGYATFCEEFLGLAKEIST
jgi:hypothetical protein